MQLPSVNKYIGLKNRIKVGWHDIETCCQVWRVQGQTIRMSPLALSLDPEKWAEWKEKCEERDRWSQTERQSGLPGQCHGRIQRNIHSKWYRVGKEREHEGAQNGRFERRRHLEIIDMNLISDGWPGVSRWNQFWNFFEIILHTFRYWAPTDPSCVVLLWELNKKVYIYLQSQSNIFKSYFSQGQRKQCSISLHRCPPWPVGCRASFERSQGAGLGLKKPESWTLHKESRPDQFHFHFICQRFYTMYNVCKHRWKLYHMVRSSLLPGDRIWTHQGSRRIPEGHLKGSGIRYL